MGPLKYLQRDLTYGILAKLLEFLCWFRNKCKQLCIFREGTHRPELLLFIVGAESRVSLIGQSPQLSHPAISPHFRLTKRASSSMIVVISFGFGELLIQLNTALNAAVVATVHVTEITTCL